MPWRGPVDSAGSLASVACMSLSDGPARWSAVEGSADPPPRHRPAAAHQEAPRPRRVRAGIADPDARRARDPPRRHTRRITDAERAAHEVGAVLGAADPHRLAERARAAAQAPRGRVGEPP